MNDPKSKPEIEENKQDAAPVATPTADKHYRSNVDPTKTVTSTAAKSARFDQSESWDEFDPANGKAIDPQAGLPAA